MTMPIAALLLHEIVPSGPVFPVVAIGVIAAVVTPLALLRRAKGARVLVIVWAVETALISFTGFGDIPPAMIGITLGVAAVVVHIRALRRPEGGRSADVAFATAGGLVGLMIGWTIEMMSGAW